MSELFREVDEALREDRAKALWRRYGVMAISGVAAVILGTSAYVLWQRYDASQRHDRTVAFAEALALAEQDPNAGAAALSAVAGLGGHQATLAVMAEAGLLAREGATAAAAGLYRQVAGDSDSPETWRQLALLLAVGLEADGGDPAALTAELEPLMADDSAWRYSARELAGVLAMRAGDVARAQALFGALAQDAQAPPGVRARAAELVDFLDG